MASRRKPKVCAQPMPNAHGEPSGHISCTLKRGHDLPHVCATDYVRHTWQPPAPVVLAPKAKPAPKPPAKPKPPRKPPAKRRARSRRRRAHRWPKPVRAGLAPLCILAFFGALDRVLALSLPHLA